MGIGVAERLRASNLLSVNRPGAGSNLGGPEKSLDSKAFLLSPRSGPSPIFRSFYDTTNICSDEQG